MNFVPNVAFAINQVAIEQSILSEILTTSDMGGRR
jgi:hypothetical protein